MTNDKIEKIISRINTELEFAKIEFSERGYSGPYQHMSSKVCGMIEVLQLITDKEYYINEDGVVCEKGEQSK